MSQASTQAESQVQRDEKKYLEFLKLAKDNLTSLGANLAEHDVKDRIIYQLSIAFIEANKVMNDDGFRDNTIGLAIGQNRNGGRIRPTVSLLKEAREQKIKEHRARQAAARAETARKRQEERLMSGPVPRGNTVPESQALAIAAAAVRRARQGNNST